MTMVEKHQHQQQRRWRLSASLALACVLSAAYILCASLVIRTRQQHRSSVTNVVVSGGDGVVQSTKRQRRASSSSSTPVLNRLRTHKVSTATIQNNVEEINNNNNAANSGEGGSGSGSGGGEGIVAKDSQGLLVEVASPPPPSDSQSESSFPQHPATTKIINGIPYSRSSHPYIVRLHWTNPGTNADESPHVSFCGGSLITPNIVLTAAHCLGKYEAYVDIHSVNAADGAPKTYKIEKSVMHPQFDDGVFGYDYGLILIEEVHLEVVSSVSTNSEGEEHWSLMDGDLYDWEDAPPMVGLHRYSQNNVDSSSTRTPSTSCTSLSEQESKEVTTLTVIGYGSTKFNTNDGPSDPSYHSLQGAEVHYVTNDECNDLYTSGSGRNNVISDDQLCASDVVENQDACQGDSGGPLVTQLINSGSGASLWTQVGIVSWGIGCAIERYPGVYSRVAFEVEWIDSVICGGEDSGNKRNGGLSPLSCVTDENGERHVRDYALEAAVRKHNAGLASDGRRRGKAVENTSSNNRNAMRRDKVELSFSSGQQKLLRMESCELLEGPSFEYDEEREVPATPPPTPPITPSPTNRPTANNDVDKTPPPPEPDHARTCSNRNKSDVDSFLIGDGKNPRRKNCDWVRRKCKRRCDEYSSCCPETCRMSKCKA